MIDTNHHNELLKACRKPSTLRTFAYVTLGWMAVIALLMMGCSACISPS